MYLIVGLGNPEEEYAGTRHNIGFEVVNKLAKKHDIAISRSKFKGLYGTGIIENEKVIILKPQTYMNLSGESIIKYKNLYKIPNEKIIIIYDDIDLELGDIRIRARGGAGTHNGMKSVVQNLSGGDFPRIRIGMKSNNTIEDLVNFVTGRITEKEYTFLRESIEKSVEAIEEYLNNGIDKAMNKFN